MLTLSDTALQCNLALSYLLHEHSLTPIDCLRSWLKLPIADKFLFSHATWTLAAIVHPAIDLTHGATVH
jgi:hypothetical protein